jgi:hypothetical protein
MMTGFRSKKAAANGQAEYFEYLDALRDSGVTNMMGAGVYLEDHFGLSRYEARDILLEWIQSFGKTRSPAAQ